MCCLMWMPFQLASVVSIPYLVQTGELLSVFFFDL